MNRKSSTCPTCPHGRGFKCVRCWPPSKRFNLYGSSFAVQAEFPTTPEGTKQANAFMSEHPGIAVLAESEGKVVLASSDDEGIALNQQDTGDDVGASPCFERGHWYVRKADGALFIVPDDRFGIAETHGPDDDTLDALEEAYRGMDQAKANWFDLVDTTAVANELGLHVVHDWQKRFDAERGYYHA